MDRTTTLSLSRRGFALGGAALTAAAAGSPALALARVTPLATAAPTLPAATPVVAFHMDALYIDWTGTAEPYRPPEGLRSAGSLAELDDTELHMLQGWC